MNFVVYNNDFRFVITIIMATDRMVWRI